MPATTSHIAWAPPRHKRVTWVVIAAIHVLFLLVMWNTQWTNKRLQRSDKPVDVLLLWPPALPKQQERADPAAAAARRRPPKMPSTQEQLPDAPSASPAPDAAIAITPPEPPASAPLDLTVRSAPGTAKPGIRNEALNDPRVVRRTSYSERFANTLGTDTTRREEIISGGRRFREGLSCTELHDSRYKSIDGFNESVSPSAKGAKACN